MNISDIYNILVTFTPLIETEKIIWSGLADTWYTSDHADSKKVNEIMEIAKKFEIEFPSNRLKENLIKILR